MGGAKSGLAAMSQLAGNAVNYRLFMELARRWQTGPASASQGFRTKKNASVHA